MRMYPRVTTDLPVTIDARGKKSKSLIENIGVGGAFLKSCPSTQEEKASGDTIIIKYHLPNHGLMEYHGRVVRKSPNGIGVSFYDLDISTKTKLWDYFINQIGEIHACPYCGERYELMPANCTGCGFGLSFDSPEYFEYLEKVCLLKKLHATSDSLDIDQLQKLLNFLDIEVLGMKLDEGFQEFVGTSPTMLEVFSKIRKVALTDLSVLILGESGTGKELTALAIHERSHRKGKPFVTINCAAIPESLLEAELFGYERGAFTGAYNSKKGKFENANGGTIFLDEVGDLSTTLQAKLLRFIEDRVVEMIGGIRGKKVDVRLIAATNCDLNSAIMEGKFRHDLYYRLNEFTINLPPVRERGEGKVILAKYLLRKFSSSMGMTKTFTKEAIQAIRNYDWPGNVREIINNVRRAIVVSDNKFITPEDLDIKNISNLSEGNYLKSVRKTIEEEKIREALRISGNNISKAARRLGVSRPSFYNLKKKYGI